MPREARCAPWGHRRTRPSLSAVLKAPRRVRDGAAVTVVLGDGREFVGRAIRLDDEKIRVFLPDGYA